MEENELQAASTEATTAICQCPQPTRLCQHAKEKVNGYYCELELPESEQVSASQLRSGQHFSFTETPYIIHRMAADYTTYITYEKPCGWIGRINRLDRIVNRLK